MRAIQGLSVGQVVRSVERGGETGRSAATWGEEARNKEASQAKKDRQANRGPRSIARCANFGVDRAVGAGQSPVDASVWLETVAR